MNVKNKKNLTKSIYSNVPILLLIIGLISTIFLNTNYIIKEIKAENTIEDINFDSPFNNTFINYANDTIRYNSNGSGIYITNPDGTVYQKGIIELRTEEGNDTANAKYESIGDQAGENVLDNGIMLFNSSSSDGELSFLNNTVAVYKDMIGYANLTTIAWQWK